MARPSRRQVAEYAAEQLSAGASSATLSKQLAAYLVAGKREQESAQLVADIALAIQRRLGQAHAVATSARPLGKPAIAALSAALKHELGVKKIELEARVDESVIGGVRIETADTTYDGTVRRKLAQLKTGS